MNVPYNPNDSTANTAVTAVIRYENERGNRPSREQVHRMTPHFTTTETGHALSDLRANGRIFLSSRGYVVVDEELLDELFDRDDALDRALGLNGHSRGDRRSL